MATPAACASGWRAPCNAPRDPAWTADGVVSDHWAPVSPVTGALDAFRWRVPVEAVDERAARCSAPRSRRWSGLGAGAEPALEHAGSDASPPPSLSAQRDHRGGRPAGPRCRACRTPLRRSRRLRPRRSPPLRLRVRAERGLAGRRRRRRPPSHRRQRSGRRRLARAHKARSATSRRCVQRSRDRAATTAAGAAKAPARRRSPHARQAEAPPPGRASPASPRSSCRRARPTIPAPRSTRGRRPRDRTHSAVAAKA